MELGSVADWVMCGVSVLSAAAVLYLGHEANKLGKAANGIADGAARLAQEAEEREARILLLYLEADIARAWDRSGALLERLENCISDAAFVSDVPYRQGVQVDVAQLEMPTVTANLTRLHVLGPPIADAIARAIGTQRSILVDTFASLEPHRTGDELLRIHHRVVSGVREFRSDIKIVWEFQNKELMPSP